MIDRTKLQRGAASGRAGYSLVEMIVTVAVIGVMTGIMIQVFSNVKESASEVIATEVMETVNLGVKKFAQGNFKIETPADADEATDEATVLGLLQTRDNTVPGTPFVDPRWNPVASSSNEDYRIQWAGEIFVLLTPGTEGSGIKVDFQARDYNQ